MTGASVVSICVAFVGMLAAGLVGLGVEGSKRTHMSGVFAAGWIMLVEGLGFVTVAYVDTLAHGVLMGVCFGAIGLGIISLPIVNRELHSSAAKNGD
ncbi:MAG: hypothetical protein ACYTG5_06850 [Planctomycetota bacterium]|jgi:hypothetical protein